MTYSFLVTGSLQDLNACELDFVQQLARGRRLVLIGDPLQAIYQCVHLRFCLNVSPLFVERSYLPRF